MRRSARAIASTLGATLALTACGGQSSSIPWTSPNQNGGTTESAARAAKPDRPLISIPQLSGDLAYTDTGRRAANAPVRVSLTLRYNNQAELDRFVASISDARSGLTRHYLTPRQFDDRYAPTALQEGRVVRALERGGFKILKRFPNRTIDRRGGAYVRRRTLFFDRNSYRAPREVRRTLYERQAGDTPA